MFEVLACFSVLPLALPSAMISYHVRSFSQYPNTFTIPQNLSYFANSPPWPPHIKSDKLLFRDSSESRWASKQTSRWCGFSCNWVNCWGYSDSGRRKPPPFSIGKGVASSLSAGSRLTSLWGLWALGNGRTTAQREPGSADQHGEGSEHVCYGVKPLRPRTVC